MIGIIDVGGGMRGVYSAGIYDFFLDNKIKFDYCLGVSAGAANLITYLAGQRDRNKRFYTDYIHRKEYMSIRNIFKYGMYLNLEYIYTTMTNSDGEDPLDYEAFTKTQAKYYAAATNAQTGEPYYFDRNDVAKDDYNILKASCALPLACKPYLVNGEHYFDGGIAEPIPYQKAFDDGCSRLVVVLTRPRDEVRTLQSNMPLLRLLLRKYPATVKAIEHRHIKYNKALEELKKLEVTGKVLISAPSDITGMKTLTKDLRAIEKLYNNGYEDGKKIADYLANKGF